MVKSNKVSRALVELASSIAARNLPYTELLLNKLKNNKTDPFKIYEAILQSYLFCGFPSTIETLRIFRKHFPKFRKGKTEYNVAQFQKSGEANCKLIYKKNYKKLIDNMNYLSPDLELWMIIEGYGKVLGRKGLSLPERELVNVSILCTVYFENQLHAHLKGCLNVGCKAAEIKKLIKCIEFTAGKKNVSKCIRLIDSL